MPSLLNGDKRRSAVPGEARPMSWCSMRLVLGTTKRVRPGASRLSQSLLRHRHHHAEKISQHSSFAHLDVSSHRHSGNEVKPFRRVMQRHAVDGNAGIGAWSWRGGRGLLASLAIELGLERG